MTDILAKMASENLKLVAEIELLHAALNSIAEVAVAKDRTCDVLHKRVLRLLTALEFTAYILERSTCIPASEARAVIAETRAALEAQP